MAEGSRRVLIVEDDPFIALDLEDIVTEAASVEIVTASSLAEARSHLATPVDFALMDVDVVGGRTYDLATTLLGCRTPFAFVSASRIVDIPEALRAVPFIAKPYRPSHIGEAVRRGLAAA